VDSESKIDAEPQTRKALTHRMPRGSKLTRMSNLFSGIGTHILVNGPVILSSQL
jgi:hypothetical protein